ncbi:hypothetical protein CCP3SC1AL1_4400001 [Gammaproteobacteria bacterium]
MALIPARKGSKRFPHKNMMKLQGKTLVEHAIDHAEGSLLINKIVVLSADPEVLRMKHAGVIFEEEPEELCGEYIQPMQYIHYIEEHYKYDVLVLLQPTSPTRKSKDVDWCIKLLLDSGVDSVVTFNRRVVHHLVPNGCIYVMRRGKEPYNDRMLGVTLDSVDIDTKEDLDALL